MQALLLSAGYGRRLEPITKSFPKPLFPVLNIPVAEYLVRYLSSFGIRNFMMNTFHLGKKLEEEIRRIDLKDIEISFSREEELLGTGGGLKKMIQKTAQETVIISNADSIYNFDIDSLVEAYRRANSAVTLVMAPYRPDSGYSKVTVNTEGLIEKFHADEDNNKKGGKSGIFTGIHILNKSKIPPFPNQDKFCIVEDYYKTLLKRGKKIHAVFAQGDWLDIGDLQKYYKTNIFILKNLNNFKFLQSHLHESYNELQRHTYVHKNNKLPDNIKLNGPVLIGEDSKIGKGCEIGPYATIGNSVKIGEDSKVKECIALNKSKIRGGCAVEKTICYEDIQTKLPDI